MHSDANFQAQADFRRRRRQQVASVASHGSDVAVVEFAFDFVGPSMDFAQSFAIGRSEIVVAIVARVDQLDCFRFACSNQFQDELHANEARWLPPIVGVGCPIEFEPIHWKFGAAVGFARTCPCRATLV